MSYRDVVFPDGKTRSVLANASTVRIPRAVDAPIRTDQSAAPAARYEFDEFTIVPSAAGWRAVQLQPGLDRRFEVGDLVTRDGSDIQRVIMADDGFGSITVECIVAPETGWCSVGETENNVARRYARVDLQNVTPVGDP